MPETDSRNTRLARLAALERRYDGPIPAAALRALDDAPAEGGDKNLRGAARSGGFPPFPAADAGGEGAAMAGRDAANGGDRGRRPGDRGRRAREPRRSPANLLAERSRGR